MDTLDPEELLEWQVYLSREPQGWERLDYLFANSTQILASCWAKKPPKLKDVMLQFKVPEAALSKEEKDKKSELLIKKIQAFAALQNSMAKKETTDGDKQQTDSV